MRIGIDVRYLSHGLVGGIHTYLENLVPRLLEYAEDHQFFLYLDDKRPFELKSVPEHVKLRTLSYKNPFSSVYNDFSMVFAMKNDDLDVVHFPASYGFGPSSAHVVITLQDEINVLPLRQIIRTHRHDLRTVGMMTYLHFLTRTAVHRANTIITVSEYSKKQIARYARLNLEKLVVIPHACPQDIQRVTDPDELADVRKRLDLNKPFILAEAFKNPAVIVRAWNLLPAKEKQNLNIVFFSRSEQVLPVVHEALAAGFARLIVRPARRDLSALYSMAVAFVFPSWIEGFGIPLLESMECGAPIIASDRGSIPEVVGDAALLIDAEDQNKLAEHLLMLLSEPSERENLRQRGFLRVKQFSWPSILQQVLETYSRAPISKSILSPTG